MSAKYDIQNIPIDKITVINPRERNLISFQAVQGNIENVGLKKPVTVRPSDDGEGYDLVCGEGRLKSFIALGQSNIPAFVRHDLSKEDAFVMSLVENMARRRHSAMDLLKGIEILKNQGYSTIEISKKVDLDPSYIAGLIKLFENGEERLLSAVGKDTIPIYTAIKIASSPKEAQEALQDAYEKEGLRGNAFLTLQKLVESRKTLGKGLGSSGSDRRKEKRLSGKEMALKFKTEIDRMRSLVDKANQTENTMMTVVECFYNLMQDENFKTLLRAEKLDTIPKNLAAMIEQREGSHV